MIKERPDGYPQSSCLRCLESTGGRGEREGGREGGIIISSLKENGYVLVRGYRSVVAPSIRIFPVCGKIQQVLARLRKSSLSVLSYTMSMFASRCRHLLTPDLGGSGSTLRVLYATSASRSHGNGTRSSLYE